MKKRTESSEAIKFMRWCRTHPIIGEKTDRKCLMVKIANERKCRPAYGALLKRMGVSKGFPDYFLPYPVCEIKTNGFDLKGNEVIAGYVIHCGLAIELKKDEKQKPSKEQLEWIKTLNENKYKAVVADNADHAIQIVKEYLG